MKTFIRKYWLTLMGIPLGALGGYIYYINWGCINGCPIKSNASTMMLYGALMGGLLLNIIEGEIRRLRERKKS